VPTAGKLLENLKAEGIEPKDIDTVILSHGHPDHIGGNTDADGKPIFSNARHVMYKDEWDFWTSEPDLSKLPVGEELQQFILMFAQKNLPPIKDQLFLVDGESEILPGITTIAAPGHTPGHMALSISSGNQKLVYISDALLHPIHLERPEWYPAFDLAPEQAQSTRVQLLNFIVDEKALMMACHFPYPGLGCPIKKQERWHWQPIEKTS
jgi:glyoxylase-like metal-dependent hydrolase (beta-lactamase superfamily II)